jgi:hypothetical protein
VHVVSQRAWGLRLRGVAAETRDQAPLCVLPSARVHRVGTPKFQFSKLNALLADVSVLRFNGRLATTAAKLEARMVRYSFPVGLFHSYYAGLIPAHTPFWHTTQKQ